MKGNIEAESQGSGSLSCGHERFLAFLRLWNAKTPCSVMLGLRVRVRVFMT